MKYISVWPRNKKQIVELLGRNSPVGGNYDIDFNEKNECSIICNSFENIVGEADMEQLREFKVAYNRGFEVGASLAWVAFNSTQKKYFAKFLIYGYSSDVPEFETYVKRFCKRLEGGVRPSTEIGSFEQNQIISSKGLWKTPCYTIAPDLPKDCVLTKSKQEIMDRIIESARQRKFGCWVGTIIFFGLIATGLWGLFQVFNI